MRKFICRLSRSVIICILLLPLNSKSQKCLSGIESVHKPFMSLLNGDTWVNNFKNKKKWEIEKKSGYVQRGTLKLPNFIGMLDFFNTLPNYGGLEVIIGMYGKKGAPLGCKQQLTLIFSPTNAKGTTLDKSVYYVIPPDGPFDSGRLEDFQITQTDKDELVANYENAIPTSIDVDNYLANTCTDVNINNPRDTKSIFYFSGPLNELITEQKYCHNLNGVKISLSKDFIGFFTSEDYKPQKKENFRLSIAFGFTDDNFNFIDITKTDGFDQRDPSYFKDKKDYVNNGQLCPTYCPH